jgi:peptide/nickel transport system permease protein
MSRLKAILKRIAHAVLVVAGVSVVVFIVTHLTGDPARLMLPLDATPEQYAALSKELGTDRPLLTQFLDYFGSALQGDLGRSVWQKEPALNLALDHVWPTVKLGVSAIALSAVLGVPLGFLAAVKLDTFLDRAVSGISILAVSIASFWLALMLILVFAVELQWLPTSGIGTKNLILPAVAAAAAPLGRLIQVGRAAMIDELSQPYVRVARAKGLSTSRTVVTNASRNALIPVVTLAAFEFASIVGAGLILIETIFNWPGIGYLTYQALIHRDFPLIQACIVVIAVIVVTVNVLIDLLYGVIDPRTRI